MINTSKMFALTSMSLCKEIHFQQKAKFIDQPFIAVTKHESSYTTMVQLSGGQRVTQVTDGSETGHWSCDYIDLKRLTQIYETNMVDEP